jgi:hypothetical protein
MFDSFREGFEVLGFHFQNWMPPTVAIIVFWIVLEWWHARQRHRRQIARN